MASIRDLKKEIDHVTQELVNECLIYAYFHKDMDASKIYNVINDILKIRNGLIEKCNHYNYKENGGAQKYFRAIRKEIHNSLIPELDKLGKLEK